MKKSEKYEFAIRAVIEHAYSTTDEKLEIIELLMAEKNLAEYCEKMESEDEGVS